MVNIRVNYQLKLGLAYDYGLSGINQYNRSSVEAVLEYSFGYRLKATNRQFSDIMRKSLKIPGFIALLALGDCA